MSTSASVALSIASCFAILAYCLIRASRDDGPHQP